MRYISPPRYLGIDQNPVADIQANFNESIPVIDTKYDVGLVLGVLEYLNDPQTFLKTIKPTADQFIILCFVNRRRKPEWTNAFTSDEVKQMLSFFWKNISYETYRNYLLAICSD